MLCLIIQTCYHTIASFKYITDKIEIKIKTKIVNSFIHLIYYNTCVATTFIIKKNKSYTKKQKKNKKLTFHKVMLGIPNTIHTV